MNKTKILIHLLENTEQFTINQLAKALDINYRIAHTQIKELEKQNIVQTQKAGKSLLCSLTGNFNENIYLAEYKRRQELLKSMTMNQIYHRYSQAKQNYILLLFGSFLYTHTKHSDIDLLAITEFPKEIEKITELIPKNIHLTTVTYKEFLNMKNSRETTVGAEAIKKNIILIGIEEYYRLLQND